MMFRASKAGWDTSVVTRLAAATRHRAGAMLFASVLAAFTTATVHADNGLAAGGRAAGANAPLMLAQAGAQGVQGVQAELDALIKAAKAEGELTFYSGATENVVKRVADAFAAKYGIRAQFVIVGGAALLQRFQNEAEAGKIAADLMFSSGNAVAYAEEGIRKGWIEAIATAGLPVVKSGEFPAKFNMGSTAIVQVAPWIIAYNTEKVKVGEVPKDWPDYLLPRWKGQIIITNPRSSDAHLLFWGMIMDKYGEQFFRQLSAQSLRQFAGGVPATNGLGAGEGSMQIPAVPAQIQAVVSKGAPLAISVPDYTTGIEMQIILTATAKARRPNASRLFTNYVMSREGNEVFNADAGSVTVYDTTRLPKSYQNPKYSAIARKEELAKLLGF